MNLEAFNALVRPIVTLAMAGGILYGFVRGLIGAEAFLAVAGGVLGFWFQKREQVETKPPVAPA